MSEERNIKVSVLVPVYNVEKYIEECIDSIINQSLREIEIICINDGSTDNSRHILESYKAKDDRIKLINKRNSGYGHSMNVGLGMATGDYVSIIESDDFVEKDMLETLYNTAVRCGADIVKGEYFNYRDGKDAFAGRLSNYPKDELISIYDTPSILYLADTIWSALYRRDFLVENNITFHETEGASFQDISFAIQGWIYASKVFFIDKPLLHYRRDNLLSSMNNPEKIFNVFDEYEWIEEKFRQKWKNMPEIEKYFVATKYGDYLNHYYRIGHLYQYALLVKIRTCLENDIQKCRVESTAFSPNVWENINNIISDINFFYKHTSKKYEDLRLELCDIKNNCVYLETFFYKIIQYPQIVIYGAGKVGRLFADALVSKGGRPDCFAVTDNAGGQEGYHGIPVKELMDIQDFAESCAIIIAVNEADQYELYCNARSYGFKNIYRVDHIIMKYCRTLCRLNLEG